MLPGNVSCHLIAVKSVEEAKEWRPGAEREKQAEERGEGNSFSSVWEVILVARTPWNPSVHTASSRGQDGHPSMFRCKSALANVPSVRITHTPLKATLALKTNKQKHRPCGDKNLFFKCT